MKTWFPLVLLGLAAGVSAEIKPSNPGFGAREVLVYSETVGSVNRTVETSLTRVGEGSTARWEYRSVGADVEATFRLELETLLSVSSETLTKAADATVRRTADYTGLKIKAAADELVVTDFGSLPVVLRGFPWGQKSAAKIATVGNVGGGGGFTIELTVVGREKVVAVGRTWDCWKVTTGLGGALSLLMAKSEWWFAAEGTHPLIKAVGPSGGPGSPTRTLLLQTMKG